MSALRHVIAQRPGGIPSAIPTVEFIDVTDAAAALGLKCRMSMSPALVHVIDVEGTLRQFRDILDATWRDPALSILRTVALQGKHVLIPMTPAPSFREVQDALRFFERVCAGINGVSDNGRLLAVPAVRRSASSQAPPAASAAPDDDTAVFAPWLGPALPAIPRPPLLIVNALDELITERIINRLRSEYDSSNRP